MPNAEVSKVAFRVADWVNRVFAKSCERQPDAKGLDYCDKPKRRTAAERPNSMFCQGDVLIRPVASLPKTLQPVARDRGRIVLAYGEVTGHAHAILDREAELLVAAERSKEDEVLNVRFLRVMAASGIDVTHEEHGTIHLAPGVYEIRQQREWTDAEEPLRVAD